MKKRGKVPPKLLTLVWLSAFTHRMWQAKGKQGKYARGKQRHVSASNRGIRNLSMESRNRHKHDRAHESAEDVFDNDNDKIPARRAAGRREEHHCQLGKDRCHEAPNKCPRPQSHRLILLRPFSGVVAQSDLKGEVDQHGQGQIFLRETFVQELEVRNCIVRLEADLGDQVDHNESLYVLQFQNATHDSVDSHDGVLLLGAVLFLENSKAESDDYVGPTPESEVAAEGEKAGVERSGAEPFVGEVGRGQGEKDGVGEELAGCQADGLRGGCVGEIGG